MNNHKPFMRIDKPESSQVPQLRSLWKETFGDTDEFLDCFEENAFSLERCRCVLVNEKVVAALYWFNCEFLNRPIAYIYAVATAENFRGKGICHALMENTHMYLKSLGYVGTILSPANEKLIHFYEKMGYQTCAYMDEISFDENRLYALEAKSISLRSISKEEFARLRRNYLPKNAVIQENENLNFLQTQAAFYAGNDFLMAAQKNASSLNALEFLGNTTIIPNILHTLECTNGTFRMPGKEKIIGMYYSLTENSQIPGYIGFIFD